MSKVTLEMKGFERLQRNLQKLQNSADGPNGEYRIKFSELFNSKFMYQFTKFESIEEMFDKGGFKIESADDFKAIPNEELNYFVRENSNFIDWKEMQTKAAVEWIRIKMGL